ncbi:unnamed protein product [Albugo candida]|uniref:Uncharacterized protein n=1 Tax=Albugo candida TaxID=65357 RepID=A0A024G3A5_9STRA|nr:unnamed protein product [Albugo candida]|eukprot:CCI40789.1 unnamed protein product [Albugo candida]
MQLQQQEGQTSAVSTATIIRFQRAEHILEEIAHEYAAKRAAGLVPTLPVPARTLLWQEIADKSHVRNGVRGKCVYGRDTTTLCACTEFVRHKSHNGTDEEAQPCEDCGHGGPWHRIVGSQNLARVGSAISNCESSRASMDFEELRFSNLSEDSTCQLDIENQDDMLQACIDEQKNTERPWTRDTKNTFSTGRWTTKTSQATWNSNKSNQRTLTPKKNVNKWSNDKLDRLLQVIQDLRATGLSECDIEEQLRREVE